MALSCFARSAHAQQAAPGPADGTTPTFATPPPERELRWYGWETLIADGSAAAMAVASQRSADAQASGIANATALTGAAVFTLGAPAIHLAKGHPVKAVADLGMRVLTPVLLAFIGYASASNDWDKIGGTVVGFYSGCLAAAVIDATVLARDEAPARAQLDSAPGTPAEETKPRWSPTVSVTPRGGSVGFSATF